MKIEKVNDNQIRCTLTREDLVSRELKISELAYGTEKAKNLFRDMMQQANYEFGFDAEDIPLMIEAIPLNAECIVLVITKVEDPEELDTRFSRFAPSAGDMDDDYDGQDEEQTEHAREVMDLFRHIQGASEAVRDAAGQKEVVRSSEPAGQTVRIFLLDSLHTVISAARLLGGRYQGESSLYKDERSGRYLLVLTRGAMTQEHFNRASNLLSEYGQPRKSPAAGRSYLEEHYSPVIKDNALGSLSKI